MGNTSACASAGKPAGSATKVSSSSSLSVSTENVGAVGATPEALQVLAAVVVAVFDYFGYLARFDAASASVFCCSFCFVRASVGSA
eukprot:1582446-Pyramimonas_sp.AAC.1